MQLHVYKSRTGFRWTVVSPGNGRVVGIGGQGFSRRIDAVGGFNLLRAPGTEVDAQFDGTTSTCRRGHEQCEAYDL